MKKWTRDTEINAPIEQVWKFLDGSLENMQKIMPQVVEHKPVKITEKAYIAKSIEKENEQKSMI
ncbi:SRPBCC family protein [Peribacillus simplex]|uniref:SRPBCC family protein n=1 Tax=Peribacillus simplex TaxID=1478 RepID=UPI00338DB558